MTTWRIHEIRDTIHGFITFDTDERLVVDSPQVQRLRNIHQLAMSYLVYPGATHKRFEHSLGVMDLAGKIYDVISAPQNTRAASETVRSELASDERRSYWRRVVRMAGLCHDIGHLPFSHAAEENLLPKGIRHETITAELILSDEMGGVWSEMTPPLKPLDVAKIAVKPKYLPENVKDRNLTDWQVLLNQVIGHDALGADRMDYLMRDSVHTGVGYGRFDHLRLLGTIRCLQAQSGDSALGIEWGGIHTAEALLLARYFMFMQVYFHHVRAAYDLHLQDFLRAWLGGSLNDRSWSALAKLTDVEVLEAINDGHNLNDEAQWSANIILNRQHFRRVYTLTREDRRREENALWERHQALSQVLGTENVRHWPLESRQESAADFPVIMPNGLVESADGLSDVISKIPTANAAYLLVPLDYREQAHEILQSYTSTIGDSSESGENND